MWLLDVFFLIVQFGHGGVVFEEPPRKATYLLDDIDGDWCDMYCQVRDYMLYITLYQKKTTSIDETRAKYAEMDSSNMILHSRSLT